MLCRIRFYISQPLLRMLYYSLIYHNFIMEISYGLILIQSDWKITTENIKNNNLYIIHYNTPSTFKKLHLLNTHQIIDLLIPSFSFGLNNNVLPPYFDDFCIEKFNVHSYNTRESKQLHMIFNRPTNYGKYCTRER